MHGTPEKYIAEARVYRGNVSQRYYVFKSYNTPQLFIAATRTPYSLPRDSRLLQPPCNPLPDCLAPVQQRNDVQSRRLPTPSLLLSSLFHLKYLVWIQQTLGSRVLSRFSSAGHDKEERGVCNTVPRIPIGFLLPSSIGRQTNTL